MTTTELREHCEKKIKTFQQRKTDAEERRQIVSPNSKDYRQADRDLLRAQIRSNDYHWFVTMLEEIDP